MFKNINTIALLVFPLVLKYVFLLCFIDWVLFDIQDVLEDVCFVILMGLLIYSDLRTKQFFKDTLLMLYLLYLVIETTSYMAVSSNFSSSFMYLLLESNPDEIKEFSSAYVSLPIVLFILILVIFFFKIRKIHFKNHFKYRNVISIVGVVLTIFILKFSGLIESNAYHNMVRGTYGYLDLQNSIKFSNNLKKEDMNALYVYDNVISTDVFTLKSVPKIITSIDIETNNEFNIHIVELFNAAGYDTYWLSNQRPISYHDNAISKIASSSKWFKFYNHLKDKHALVLDEVLLPDYQKILKKAGKKVIFIRLIGTHFDYNKRYPKAYNRFALHDEGVSKEDVMNDEYDNAVLYNDYIVSELIRLLEVQNQKSALLYVSDHGENIYDDTDFFGRSEEVLTKSMFEIPFILWTSKYFEYPDDFIYKPNRKFMADHTFESIGHVFGVAHKTMNSQRSIFSSSFENRTRKVIDKIDFDTYFNTQDE